MFEGPTAEDVQASRYKGAAIESLNHPQSDLLYIVTDQTYGNIHVCNCGPLDIGKPSFCVTF